MICSGLNTTSAPSRLRVREIHSSRGENGLLTFTHGTFFGSSASCISSWMSMVTGCSWCRASIRLAPNRLIPSWWSVLVQRASTNTFIGVLPVRSGSSDGQEPSHLVAGFGGRLVVHQVADVRQHHELRVGEPGRQGALPGQRCD